MPLSSRRSSSPRILVVHHSERAPGGNFCKALLRRGAILNDIRPVDGDGLPADQSGYDGLVVLGGPQHAFEDTGSPHFRPLMEMMRGFDQADKPVAGICLGCQLLARAWGGTAKPLGFLEYGFTSLEPTEAAQDDPLLGGLRIPELMEFHEDTFDLPDEAVLLARSKRCANQCFKVGGASYGFQFHLEADLAIVRNWIHEFRFNEAFKKHSSRYSDEFFQKMEKSLTTFLLHSERFCETAAGRWLALTERHTGRAPSMR